MSEHTISNQTCTKCQNCGQWTNYAGDEHHQARETEFAALRKDSDYLVTSELMRAEVIQQRDELLAAAKIGEGFMSGFEGDELQEGIDENLANHDGFQADLKFGFTSDDADKNERGAMAMFDSSNQERADNVIKAIAEMMEGGSAG
jgi:hypothetical protein